MSTLKQTATIEQLKSELRTLIGAIEQAQYFSDNGTTFEQAASRRYAIEKALKARDILNKINAEENQDKTGT